MVNCTNFQIKPAELNLHGLNVNEESLVHVVVIVPHDQDTVILRGREGEDGLEFNIHLREIHVY